MKILLITIAFVALLASGARSTQTETATFTLAISRTGATQAEARRNLLDALGEFAKSLPGDADIYQRLPDGSLDLSNQGQPRFDRVKVEARIATWLESQIDGADVTARAATRKAAAAATIDQEESAALRARKPQP